MKGNDVTHRSTPIVRHRADPWIYKHRDGFYYFTATVPEYDRLELRRARCIQDLGNARAHVIWERHQTGEMSHYIWAPEIHFIDGRWYIYFAADNKTETHNGVFDHRMYVLENGSANPIAGTWTERGRLETPQTSFSLDATTFAHRGSRYLLWAQRDHAIKGNSNLYLSRMKDPWTLDGETVMISRPEFDWEGIGFWVNEGPAVIARHGRLFVTYSASATDANYCMGLLWADEQANLLSPSSWHKSPQPILATSEAEGLFGPGHNSFTRSEDDQHDLLVFHARVFREIPGDPLDDGNRMTFVRPFTWTDQGMPDFS